MPIQCSICISTFKDPVCLPCGHLYCKKCLSDHVNVPTNPGMTSKCPDCRTVFNIAIPDLNYLPEKYHPFISHAVRRVYIDVAAHSTLQKKLKHAEKRLEDKRQGEELLLKRCEGLQAALFAHRDGEASANAKLREAEKVLKEAEADYVQVINLLESQLSRMELENRKLNVKCKKLTSKAEVMEERIKHLEKIVDEADDRNSDSSDSASINYLSSSPRQYVTPQLAVRTIKPLPRRTLQRRVREESDSPPPNFLRPKRARMGA